MCFSNSVDAVPCRIAFERGKERHFSFLAISMGTSGWIILAEELPQKPRYGIVRVVAPLSGCNVSVIISFHLCKLYLLALKALKHFLSMWFSKYFMLLVEYL